MLDRAVAVGGDPRSHRTWLATRPRGSRDRGRRPPDRGGRESGVRVHVVHVSAPETVERIRGRARTNGVAHHRARPARTISRFAAEEIPDGATEYKCAPPIRERRSRDGLWDALREGTLDAVVSDHSPAPPALKLRETGDFLRAWGGIASLQLRLPAVWTGASRARPRPRAGRRAGCAPGRRDSPGSGGRKGAIAPGHDADLVRLGSGGRVRGRGGDAASPPPSHPVARTTPRRRSCRRRTFGASDLRSRGGSDEPPQRPPALDASTHDQLHRAARSRRRAPRRPGPGWRTTSSSRPRRTSSRAPAGVAGGRVHRPRQVDGRLGDAAPAHARSRLVHRPARSCPRVVRGVVVDTSYLPRQLSRAVLARGRAAAERPRARGADAAMGSWTEVLPRSPLSGDAQNSVRGRSIRAAITHLRLQHLSRRRRGAAPGVRRAAFRPARSRAGHGAGPRRDRERRPRRRCSDMFFGHRHNLILPGRSTHMGDGWETQAAPRSRPRLGHRAARGARVAIERVELDTDHFKGNAPESCSVDIRDGAGTRSATELLPRTAVEPDAQHRFDVRAPGPATHARLAIYPDGGIARLRLFGTVAA